jgi:putative heme-binding domain-containing protein
MKRPRHSSWFAFPGLTVVLCMASIVAAQHNYTPADIEDGGRLYQFTCARCHGPDGDAIAGLNLGRGQFKRVTTDDEIARVILNGIPGTSMPPNKFSEMEAGTIVAYLRSLETAAAKSPGMPGVASRGQALFEGKGKCAGCHGLNGRGSRFGPDLGDIGTRRRAAEIERSILYPDADINTDYRFVRAVTRDGVTIRGRLLNQDLFTLQVFDSNERLQTLPRTSLREVEVLKSSAMPRAKLDPQDVADLVSYLRTMKGAQ